jgi:hypothetical protein
MSLVEAESVKRNEKGQVLPGSKLPGAGRPKGSRVKLAELFVADLYDAWTQHGTSVIDLAIREQPVQFLKVIAQILPRDVNVTVRQLDELSDEQLLMRLRQVTEMARPLLIDAKAIESPKDAIEDVPVVIEPAKR